MERFIGDRIRRRRALGRWRPAVMLLVPALVLTGCLDGEVEVTVDGDGSGRIVVEAFPSPQVMAALDDLDVEAALAGSFTGVDGFEFSEINENNLDGYRLVVPFRDHRRVVPILLEGGSVLGQPVVLFSSFSLEELDDGGWQLSADINPIAQVVAPGLGSATAALDELADALERSSPDTGFELSISLPGEVVSTNADRSSGGTATWVLDRTDAPPQLRMRTEPASFPTPLQLVLGGGALVVLLGVVLALAAAGPSRRRNGGERVRRTRKRRRGSEPESAWAPPPGSIDAATPSYEPPRLPPLTASGTAAGWYPDPDDPQRTRWWDGEAWTDQVSEGGST